MSCADCGHPAEAHDPWGCFVAGCDCYGFADDSLDPRTHARNSDPDTSHMAAAQVSKIRATAMKRRLLDVYGSVPGGLTAEEATKQAGYTAEDGAWKRVSDLRLDDLVADTGQRRVGSSGRQQMVLAITDKGRATL